MTDQSILSSRAIVGRYFARREENLLNAWPEFISNLFPSDQGSEQYAMLGFSPALREWVGGRIAKGLRQSSFTIPNKLYEGTLEVSLDDVRRDKTGQIMARVDEFADQSEIHWASLLTAVIEAGESTVCYDGQYFFDTDHVEGDSGSQSNDLTYAAASGTSPTKEEFQLATHQAVAAIMGFKNDQGQVMNPGARKFRVMVPLNYLAVARAAFNREVNIALSGNVNPTELGFDITVDLLPESSWTTKFVVFREDSPIKALIRQEETPLEFKSKAEGSEFEFDNRAWQFGVEGWRGVGYGYWQRACLTTFT